MSIEQDHELSCRVVADAPKTGNKCFCAGQVESLGQAGYRPGGLLLTESGLAGREGYKRQTFQIESVDLAEGEPTFFFAACHDEIA